MLQEVDDILVVEEQAAATPKTPRVCRKKAALKTPKGRLIWPEPDFPDLLSAPSKAPPIRWPQPHTKKTPRRRAAKKVEEVVEEIFEPPATVSKQGRMSRRALLNDEFVANQRANQKKK
jgi:hypothetical protein